jgi:HJR/Mrr/RecB family endonuclease
MESSREFHLSERKKKSDKQLYVAMAFGGILLSILSCWLFNADVETEGNYLLSCIFVIVPMAGFYMVFGGVSLYMETVGRKWKLVVSEKGISEFGHLDSKVIVSSKKVDWSVPWEEIREIFPPNPQEDKQAIIIFPRTQSYSNYPYIIQQGQVFYTSEHGDKLYPADTHKIYDYDNLSEIYSYIKDLHQKFEKKQNDELAKQKQERDYFQRIKRLEDIQNINPIQFEKLVSNLFKKMGYDVLLTKISRDEGIDLILSKNGKKSIVQCKRYSGTVGQPIARDLYGSMIHNRAEDAYLITTGVFSLPAKTWASGKPIHLVDGKMLIEWIETILGSS